MGKTLTLRLMLAAGLALVALFLGPILVTSLWLRVALLIVALLLVASGWRRLAKRR